MITVVYNDFLNVWHSRCVLSFLLNIIMTDCKVDNYGTFVLIVFALWSVNCLDLSWLILIAALLILITVIFFYGCMLDAIMMEDIVRKVL